MLPHDSDTNVSEAGRCGPVAGMGDLPRLALAALGSAPHFPVVPVADGVARIPELGCDAGIGAVSQKPAPLAILDFVAHFGAELKIVAPVVNGPGPVCVYVDSIFSIGYKVVQRE